MAEMSSNSSAETQCSPPTKKARSAEEDTADDAFKPVGSLTFRIDNFREFSNSPPEELTSVRHCDAKVSVRGLTFGLAVCPVRRVSMKDPAQEYNSMGIIVTCKKNASGCDVKGDGSWSCLASMSFQFKASSKSRGFTHKFFYSKEKSSLEWHADKPLCFEFEYLMDTKNGFYNDNSDTLVLIAEISVDAPVGILELPKMDTIQVNEETVEVNKNLLAVHSRYFRNLFCNEQYTEGQSGECKVNIEAPATVEHFKRMVDTMSPMNKPLSDECIEGVLHLANQFLVADVEGKCVEFLREKSTKSALFIYRLADKYGYTALKNDVLNNLDIPDCLMSKANMAEYVQLGSNAAEEFMARCEEYFPPRF